MNALQARSTQKSTKRLPMNCVPPLGKLSIEDFCCFCTISLVLGPCQRGGGFKPNFADQNFMDIWALLNKSSAALCAWLPLPLLREFPRMAWQKPQLLDFWHTPSALGAIEWLAFAGSNKQHKGLVRLES